MNQTEKWKQCYKYSVICKWLDALYSICQKHWTSSKAVQGLITQTPWQQSMSQNTLAFRLWCGLRSLLTALYDKLKLEKIFHGSQLISPTLSIALMVFCSALLPTMAVLALVLLGFATYLLDLLRHKEKQLQSCAFSAPCLFTASFYLGISFTSVSPRASLPVGLIMTCFMLTPILLINYANNSQKNRLLTQLLVASATLVGLYGIYQFIFGAAAGSGWVDTNMFGNSTVRVYSTLQNPNMLAQYLVLVLPFSAALLLQAKDWNTRFLYLFSSGVITIALLCTYSRGGWLGALIAGVIFVILLQPKLLLLAPIIAPIALVALYFVLPESIIERFTSIGNLKDSSTSYRVSIWMGSIALIKDYWICGIGPGVEVFNLVYPYYSYATATAQHSHNLFLQMMVDGGVFMLLLFIGMIFSFCRCVLCFLDKEKNSSHRLFVIASISGVGGFLAQGMTDYSFYNYRVALAFFIALGLGMSWASATEDAP